MLNLKTKLSQSKFFNPSKPGSEAGFSLIELLISVGLLGLVVFAVSQILLRNTKSAEQVRITAMRDQLLLEMEKKVLNPRALMNSRWVPGGAGTPASAVVGNERLLRCLTETYSQANLCTSGVTQEFVLYEDSQLATTAATLPIAGTTANPVRYTKDGSPCTVRQGALPVPAFLCPFEAKVTFQAICKPRV